MIEVDGREDSLVAEGLREQHAIAHVGADRLDVLGQLGVGEPVGQQVQAL